MTQEQVNQYLNHHLPIVIKELIAASAGNNETSNEPSLISAQQACKLLQITEQTLIQWDKKGITKPIRKGNRKYYSLESLQENK